MKAKRFFLRQDELAALRRVGDHDILRPVRGIKLFSPDYDRQWHPHVLPPGEDCPDQWTWWEGPAHGPSMYHMARSPFGKAGDIFWVPERIQGVEQSTPGEWRVHYALDGAPVDLGKEDRTAGDPPLQYWRGTVSPALVPVWATRFTLEVMRVDIIRVQDIDKAAAREAGLDVAHMSETRARAVFRRWWERVHGGESWRRNDWVWVGRCLLLPRNARALEAAVQRNLERA